MTHSEAEELLTAAIQRAQTDGYHHTAVGLHYLKADINAARRSPDNIVDLREHTRATIKKA